LRSREAGADKGDLIDEPVEVSSGAGRRMREVDGAVARVSVLARGERSGDGCSAADYNSDLRLGDDPGDNLIPDPGGEARAELRDFVPTAGGSGGDAKNHFA